MGFHKIGTKLFFDTQIPSHNFVLYVVTLELVSKELNHLAAILHVYAGGLIFFEEKKNIIFF
jgi:hypothetical protein